MKKQLFNLAFAGLIILASGCGGNKDRFPDKVTGYKPIYVSKDKLGDMIYSSGPIDIKNPGQLYIKGNYIYQNEVDQGVHVINNTNPESPLKEAFIRIPGNQNIAIKDHTLYANLPTGIVIIDIADPKKAVVRNYIKDGNANSAVPNVANRYTDPKTNRTFFECVDDSKGIVIGWEKTELVKPDCYIN